MTAERWIVLLATCFACVSSNDEQFQYGEPCEKESNKMDKVEGLLGSHVLLPCKFPTSMNKVKWSHIHSKDVVHLSFNSIRFMDHRYGRVKVFPNQASEGNFSIYIDHLAKSDLGRYRCQQGNVCHHVQLFEKDLWSEKMLRLTFICAGVTLVILLFVGAYWCYKKCIGLCYNKTDDNRNEPVITVANAVDNFFVYENDDQCPTNVDHTRNRSVPPEALQDPAGPQPGHSSSGIYPNLNEVRFERVESQRRQNRFHIGFITRLREASIRRHYYVNQVELNRQQAAAAQAETHHRAGVGKQKDKNKCEYTNPIYNRSTDHLDQL